MTYLSLLVSRLTPKEELNLHALKFNEIMQRKNSYT